MNVLIIKLGAAGDVVRTTALLHLFSGDDVTWITSVANLPLLQFEGVRAVSVPDHYQVTRRHYDLVINLEDSLKVAHLLKNISCDDIFGAYIDGSKVTYTENARPWFDMSLVSRFGLEEANRLKLHNRYSYQELIYKGLGKLFSGQEYILPTPIPTGLTGDVALCPWAGSEWPIKNWAFYPELREQLEFMGFKVNILPHRWTLLQHIWDVQHHRCLISGDSLPMHLALGSGIPCVTFFTCTSPWEIFSYLRQTKLISPLLNKFFYQREYDTAATNTISVEQVIDAVVNHLNNPLPAIPTL